MIENKEYIVRFTQEVSVTVKVSAAYLEDAEEFVVQLWMEDEMFKDVVTSEPFVISVEAVEADDPSVSSVIPMLDYTKED